MPEQYRPVAVSQEFVTGALASLELRLTQYINTIDERNRTRMEELKVSIAANPETFAGLKARMANTEDAIDDLQKSDKRWAGFNAVIAGIIAALMAFFRPSP